MKKTASIGLFFFSLIYQGCEDDKDTSPPYASIIFPEESSLVSEVITIQCEASDNDSVKFIELWIDSLSTGIKDSSSPYEFSWNTVPYQDSTEHLLMVKAEDINNNISFSTSVLVLVDNSNSYPQSLNIKTINPKNIVYIDSLLFARRLLKRESYKQKLKLTIADLFVSGCGRLSY